MSIQDKLQIFAYGDSIVQGFYDSQGGWVQRLRAYLEQNDFKNNLHLIRVFNMGISGNTSFDLFNRFDYETKNRVRYPNPIFLFLIGTNDAQYTEGGINTLISLNQFEKNIQLLIAKAKSFSSLIMFLGLTPVDEQRTTPCSWKPSISYKNQAITTFNNTLAETCAEQHIPFINLYDEWMQLKYKELLADGLHPNDEGHKKIFETVRDFLISKNIINSL